MSKMEYVSKLDLVDELNQTLQEHGLPEADRVVSRLEQEGLGGHTLCWLQREISDSAQSALTGLEINLIGVQHYALPEDVYTEIRRCIQRLDVSDIKYLFVSDLMAA